MPKYKIVMKYSDGTSEEEDDIFSSEEAAEEYGCCNDGAETLNLSNPGDYPIDEYESPDYEIIEIGD